MASDSRNGKFDDKRMELTEHLGELRTRIIRSIWYLVIAAVISYQFFKPIYGALYKPLLLEMEKVNQRRIDSAIKDQASKAGDNAHIVLELPHTVHDIPTKEEFNQLVDEVNFIIRHPVATPLMSSVFRVFYEMFTVRVTLSCMFGLILALPAIMYEFALFVTPALTQTERKPLRVLMPLSTLMLVFGIAVAYRTMFYAMGWFLGYLNDYPQPAVLMQDPNDYILFFVKMMAAFGIAFQLPVVLMAGAFAGIVNSKMLIKNWRWGVMIAIMGGVLTPANDPMSWVLMVVPLLILYFGSIPLVMYVEKLRKKPKPA